MTTDNGMDDIGRDRTIQNCQEHIRKLESFVVVLLKALQEKTTDPKEIQSLKDIEEDINNVRTFNHSSTE